MTDCVFCKIVAGEIPSEKVYEDGRSFAFLDIRPVSKGHILCIPKEHHAWFYEAPDAVTDPLFRISKKLAFGLKKALGCDYVQLSIVGKDVPHVHIHLIPRYLKDALKGWETRSYEDGEAFAVASKIRARIS